MIDTFRKIIKKHKNMELMAKTIFEIKIGGILIMILILLYYLIV